MLLTVAALLAFVLSYLLGLIIGARPAVVLAAAGPAVLCAWDSRSVGPPGAPFDSPAGRDPAGPPSPVYPATLEISFPLELNRWLPLITWLLAIPHFIALFFVGIGAFFAAVYGFFIVVFTGTGREVDSSIRSAHSGGATA